MKKHGHYCKVCGEYKANEKFSGKGHAAHVCKSCASLPPEHTPNARRRSPAATAPAQTHACRSLRCAPLWHIPHISERKASDNCKANFRPLFPFPPLFGIASLCVPVPAAPGSRQHAPASRRSPCSTAPAPQQDPQTAVSHISPPPGQALRAASHSPCTGSIRLNLQVRAREPKRHRPRASKIPLSQPLPDLFVYSAFIILNIFSIVNDLSMIK